MADTKIPTGSGKVTNVVRLGVMRQAVQSVHIVDTDLVVTLKNGKKVVIPDGAIKAMMDPDFRIAFQDTDVLASDVLRSAGPLDVNGISTTTLTNADSAKVVGVDNNIAQSGDAIVESQSAANGGFTAAVNESGPSGALSLAPADPNGATTPVTLSGQPDASSVLNSSPSGISSAPTVAALTPSTTKGGILSFFDSLPPGLGALGALGALALVGRNGSGSDSASAPVTYTPYNVSGEVVLGPVVSQLEVVAYDKSGNKLYAGESDSSGNYSFRVTNGYKGAILIVVSDANGNSVDYRDEATGQAKSLGSVVVRSASVADGTNDVTINVTPLSELAVRQMGVATNAAPDNTSTVSTHNTQVAAVYGLNNVVTDPITTVIDSNGNASTVSGSTTSSQVIAQTYGQALASLSGLDSTTVGDVPLSGLTMVQTALNNAIASLGSTPSASALQAAVAANLADSLVNANLAPVISFNSTSGNSVTVKYSWLSVGDVVTLYDNGNAVTSYTVGTSDIANRYVVLNDSMWGQGSHTLTASVSAISIAPVSSASLSVPTGSLDSASYSGTSHTVTNINQNVVYDVTATSGDTVTVTVGGNTYTAVEVVAGSGHYQATITATLSDGSYTPVITAVDTAGNASTANGTAYTVKTTLAAPTGHLDSTSDSGTSSSDGLTNVKQNDVYDIVAESGDSVTVTVGGSTYTAVETVTGSGNYQATITAALADGSYTPTITVVDVAGNTATASGTGYTVITSLPSLSTQSAALMPAGTTQFISGATNTMVQGVTGSTSGAALFAMKGTITPAVVTDNSGYIGQVQVSVTSWTGFNATQELFVAGASGISLSATNPLSGMVTVGGVTWNYARDINNNITFSLPVSSNQGLATTSQASQLLNSLYWYDSAGTAGTYQIGYKLISGVGNTSQSYTETYVITPGIPTAATAITGLSNDTIVAGNFLTTAPNQTVSGTFSGALRTGDTIQVSADGGATWVNAVVSGAGTWSANGITLQSGIHTLISRVVDMGGSLSTATQGSQSYTLDISPTLTATITAVTDSVGATSKGGYLAVDYTGVVAQGASTDDSHAVISGTISGALAAGQVVNVYDGAVLLGSATVSGTTWVYTPTSTLAAGTHSFTAAVVNSASGAAGTASVAYTVNEQSMSTISVTPHTGVAASSGYRYIMLYVSGAMGNWGVQELQAISNGVNVALGKTVIVGGEGTFNNSAASLVDGSTSTSWAGSNTAYNGAWVEVDLGQPYALSSISVLGNYLNNSGNSYVFASASDLQTAANTSLAALQAAAGYGNQITFSTGTSNATISSLGYSTVDTTPTLSGTLGAPLAAGESVQIYDGNTLLGTATVSGMNWTYTPGTALAAGSHTLYAKLMNGSTVEMAQTMPLYVTAATTPTQTATITAVTDNVSASSTGGYPVGDYTGTVAQGASTDDSHAVISGTISAALAAGQVVNIYDGTVLLGSATVSGTSWTYTPSSALAAGTHNFTAAVLNSASGAAGAASSAYTINEQSMSTIFVTPHTGVAALSSYRYIMVYVSGTMGNWGIKELQAISNGVNVALGKTVIVGGEGTYNNSAASLVDGSTSTGWAGSNTSYSGAWVEVDLGQPYALSSISVLGNYLNSSGNSYVFASASDLQTAANTSLAALQAAAGYGNQITSSTGTSNATLSSLGYSTVDTNPTLSGTLGAPLATGESVQIYDGSTLLGTATVNGKTWNYTPGMALATGLHTLYAKLMNGSTVEMAQTIPPLYVMAATAPTQTATITAVTDNVGNNAYGISMTGAVANGTSTDDPHAVISGTISAALAAGQVVNVYDGAVLLGVATVSGTTWTYTPTSTLAAGTHSFTAAVVNPISATTGTASSAYTVNEQSMSTISVIPHTGVTALSCYRYIMLYVSGTMGNWSVQDLQAISNGVNVALGKTVIVGGEGTYNNSTANLVDGSTSNRWAGSNTSYTGAWVEVDLGQSYALSSISVLGNYLNNSGNSYVFASANDLQTAANTSLAALQAVAGYGNQITSSNSTLSSIGYTSNATLSSLGYSTVDTNPTLSGTLGAPLATGESVQIYDGSTLLGTATVSGMSWTYTPGTALAAGSHTLYAKLMNGSTVEMAQTIPLYVTAATTPTQTVTVTAVTDNVGNNAYGTSMTGSVANGTSTDDPHAVISGTISAALTAGQLVNVYDGTVLLGSATVSGTTWTYTPTSALAAGTHSFTAVVVSTNSATTGTPSSTAYTINEESVSLTVTAHSGVNSGTLTAGATTIDTQPTLSITLGTAVAAGERVAVYDNGTFLGTANGSGTSYSFTPTTPLAAGGHALVAQVEATAGSAITGRAVASFYLVESAQATPLQTVAITGVTDAASLNGSVTGNVVSGTGTDDLQPTIAGTVSAVLALGQQLAVYDNGNLLGYAALTGTTWTYQLTTALSIGSHAFTAKVVDVAAGLTGSSAAVYNVIEQGVTLTSVSDSSGVASIGSSAWAIANGQPSFSGTLGAALGGNEYLAVFSDQAYLGTASVTGTSWTFSPGTALTSGNHILRFEVVSGSNLNNAGYGLGHANSGAVTVTVDGSTPTAVATITSVTDNLASVVGVVANGGTADDPNPTVSGTLSTALLGPNQAVEVFDNGTLLGNATVNNFNWSFTPTTALAVGNHSLTAKVVNLATGASTATSSAYTFDEQSVTFTAITDHTGPLTGNVLVSSGTTTTDDSGMTLSGTLGHALSGQVLSLYDGSVYLGAATVSGTSWSYTGTLSQGTHSLTAVVEVTAGSGLALAKTTAALTVQSYDPVYSSISNFSLALPGLNQVLDLRQMGASVQLDELNVASTTNTVKVTASAIGRLGITDAYTAASGWSGALMSGDRQLVVDGASGGTVNIDTSGWTQGGTVTHGSVVYNSYTNGTAQLLVDTHLTVQKVL